MKIYFAGSIRGGRDNQELYFQMIEYLKNYGTVLTEHVGSDKLLHQGENKKTDKYIHNRDLEWILESDVIIAEVSTPSLGVGYEIGRGMENKKPILCLYKPQQGKKLSAMIGGCSEIVNREYNNLDEAKKLIDEFLQTYTTTFK